VKWLAIKAIGVYQFLFSFDHSFWSKYVGYRVCIHHPTCSEYTKIAIDKYGVLIGSWMGMKRIWRCRPGMPGGYDPVPGTT